MPVSNRRNICKIISIESSGFARMARIACVWGGVGFEAVRNDARGKKDVDDVGDNDMSLFKH